MLLETLTAGKTAKEAGVDMLIFQVASTLTLVTSVGRIMAKDFADTAEFLRDLFRSFKSGK